MLLSCIQSIVIICLGLGVCFGQRCGLSANSTRIVGGQPSGSQTWPWMVLLKISVRTSTAVKVAQCGATIISEEWILTAAHCVDSTSSERVQSIEVTLGEYDTKKNEGTELRLSGTEIYLNDFDDSTNANDIALVKLSQRLDFNGRNRNLQPICLRSTESGVDPNRCYATGWGKTSDGGSSSTLLRQVQLPILGTSTCQSRWGRLFRPQFQLCAGYMEGGRDTCQGDSGGPLSCQLANGVWVQEGITSFGYGCASPRTPGVYTRVSSYVPWIERVTRLRF